MNTHLQIQDLKNDLLTENLQNKSHTKISDLMLIRITSASIRGHVNMPKLSNISRIGLGLTISMSFINEPRQEKNNNLGSDQFQHKTARTVTEAGWMLKISDLRRRGIVLSI